MNRAFLSLGGNLGNRLENLGKMRDAISRKCGEIIKTSGVFETAAWGHRSKRDYLNQVIEIQTQLTPEELLKATMAIEKRLGRDRSNKAYLDRTADIDILFYNDLVVDSGKLTLPHPRLHLRNFVLRPLEEIAAGHRHPVLKKTVRVLRKENKDQLAVRPYSSRFYLAIEGNIGSGKTTLAKAMVKRQKAWLIPELFEEISLLPLFYEDPDLYSFPLEYSFLISRFEQLKKSLNERSGLLISDFSIYKSLWFAAVNLKPKEYKLFKKHFDAFTKQLPEPDLIVFLNTTKNNLLKNIKKRGRPYEQTIQGAYLSALDKEYKKGLKRIAHIPTLQINLKHYDKTQEADTLKRIEKYVKENFGGNR